MSRPAPKTTPKTAPPPTAPARRFSRPLVALCLALGLAAVGYSAWFWHQSARPGRTFYSEGLDAASAKQFGRAVDAWRKGTEQDPTFAQNWLMLGDLYAAARQWPTALPYYGTAAKLLPDDGLTWLKLARTEQAVGDSKAALDAARRAARLRPQDADAQSLDGHLESDVHQNGLGLAAMRRANALRPNDSEIVRELAQQEVNVRDIDGAERDLAPFAQAHPQDAEAAYLMGVIALAKPPSPSNLQTGLHYAQIAAAAEPTDADCQSVLGQLYLNNRQPDRALPVYQAAVRANPTSEKILFGLVTAFTRLGNPKAAAAWSTVFHQTALRHNDLRHLETFLQLTPGDLAARLRYARLLTDDAQFRPAQVQYERCVRDFPRDPRTHPALAAFFNRLGFPDEARKAARPDYVPQ